MNQMYSVAISGLGWGDIKRRERRAERVPCYDPSSGSGSDSGPSNDSRTFDSVECWVGRSISEMKNEIFAHTLGLGSRYFVDLSRGLGDGLNLNLQGFALVVVELQM